MADHTGTIPIVFVSVTDPVSNGFVTDLAHPGGNITGFTNFETTMGGKWIELLKKIVASLARRVGVIFNPDTAPGGGAFFLRSVAASAPALEVEVLPFPVRSDDEIARAVTGLGGEPGGGLIVTLDVSMAVHRPAIIAQAATHRVPTVFPWRYGANDGGLSVVWGRRGGPAPARGRLCRSYPEGDQAGGPAGRSSRSSSNW